MAPMTFAPTPTQPTETKPKTAKKPTAKKSKAVKTRDVTTSYMVKASSKAWKEPVVEIFNPVHMPKHKPAGGTVIEQDIPMESEEVNDGPPPIFTFPTKPSKKPRT